jgi:hypothetical protein
MSTTNEGPPPLPEHPSEGRQPCCRIVPFVPGRRPTDEDARPGLGSSDSAAMVTGTNAHRNRAVLLVELSDLPDGARVQATLTIDGRPVDGWKDRALEPTTDRRQRLVILPDEELGGIDLGFRTGFLRRASVEIRVVDDAVTLASDTAVIELCDVRNLGSLYERIVHRVLVPDTTRQAAAAGVPDPGPAYHPWYPVLLIGSEKAALYTRALVGDIVDKQHHLTDPTWLLRVGVYLELLTCIGIFEAVKDDLGDLLDEDERTAFEESDVYAEIRERIDPAAWRGIWAMRRISFPRRGTPRTGPVSVLNLLRKKNTTLRFLHAHHEDLRQAIELAGTNQLNSQETWQRVFRDAERAVLHKSGEAFPELGFLPPAAREVVLWQRLGPAVQQGVYPTACYQYRASMNTVASWAKQQGLMNHQGAECVPPAVSLLEAYMNDRRRLAMLQRQDGYGPALDVSEPVTRAEPTIEEVEALLAQVPILSMLDRVALHGLALEARPLLLGPTQRFLVQGQQGTSLFLVGEGSVEVWLHEDTGGDRLIATLGPGEVVGEMALLTGEPRTATVRSVDETVVYEIGRQQYEPLLLAHPQWRAELTAIMEQRLLSDPVSSAGRGGDDRPRRRWHRLGGTLFRG